MKWENFDGASVDAIAFFKPGETGQEPVIRQTGSDLRLTCAVEYMGDRTDVWIVQTRDGKEVARHNARMLETIMWAN